MKNKKTVIMGVSAAIILIAVIVALVLHKSADSGENTPKVTQTPASVQQNETAEAPVAQENVSSEVTQEPVQENAATTAPAQEQKVYTPTFMYFVDKDDADYSTVMKYVDELKSKYDGKVVFDIIDVDEQADRAANFPAAGNTPFLIMLNTKNDPCAFEFKCTDKAKLEAAIENSMK